MTGIITTRMPYSADLSANQANTQQVGKEFRSAIGEQKLAFAPAIAPLALVAILAVALVGCWGLVQNSAGNSKNEPLPTPEELARSIANLFQGKSDEFTPIARKVLANPEIRGKLDAATGGTVLRADVGKQGGAENAKVVFRSLYNQALQKSLANPRLTPKQRADLIALGGYIFKADETPNSEQSASSKTQEGVGEAKKAVKLKKPRKPKIPKVSKPFIKKLPETQSDLGHLFFFKALFRNSQALQQLKQILAMSKSSVFKFEFATKLSPENIANLERFIVLAERNFFSGVKAIKKDIMEMTILSKLIGF
jgi:hypothetical protein